MHLLPYRDHSALYEPLEHNRASRVDGLFDHPAASLPVPVRSRLDEVSCLRTESHGRFYPADGSVFRVVKCASELYLMLPKSERQEGDVFIDGVGDFTGRWIAVLHFIFRHNRLHRYYESMVMEAIDYGLGINIRWNRRGHKRVESRSEPHVALQDEVVSKRDFKTPKARRCISIYADVGSGKSVGYTVSKSVATRLRVAYAIPRDIPRSAAHIHHPETV